MNKKIALWISLALVAVAFCIITRDYYSLRQTGASKIDATILKNSNQLPFGYTYNRYIKESNFNLASPNQKKFIAAHAFVIADKNTDKVSRLKEFSPSDTITGLQNFDSLGHDFSELKKDTLSIEISDDQKYTGYVNLSKDALLYFPIQNHKEWKIMVDISELKPISVNGEMMGVFVEKGKHHIELSYSNKYIYRDLLLTICCIAIFVLVWYAVKYKANESTKKSMNEMEAMFYNKKNYLLFVFIAIPIIIFFYFFKYKTNTIYGDDLLLYQERSKFNLSDIIFHPISGLNGRSLSRFVLFTMVGVMKKNIFAYYVFNVAVQSINTIIFLFVLNIIFRSYVVATFFALITALSRFSFYDMSQLTFGGGLEGLAMTFFLLSLYYILNAMVADDNSTTRRQILMSILFANITVLFTHPRYMVIFPFLFFVTVFFPFSKKLSIRQKVVLSLGIIGSLIMNVMVRKYVYHVPVLIGTAGSSFHISLESAVSFFIEAVYTLFQINTGPEYLIGSTYTNLLEPYKTLAAVLAGGLIVTFLYYLYQCRKVFSYSNSESQITLNIDKNKGAAMKLFVFIFLLVYAVLLLVPAVSTIRLEQRWLQAPLCCFVLMLAVALSSFRFRNEWLKTGVYSFIVALFLFVNYTYLNNGVDFTYMKSAERNAKLFETGIKNGVLHNDTRNLYLLVKHRSPDAEGELEWILYHDYFFDFYENNHTEHLVFVDSAYQKTDSGFVSSFPGFDKNKDQVIYIKESIHDITNEYLKDSLRTFVKSDQY